MDQFKYAHLDEETRLSHLEAEAYKVVADEDYTRSLTDEEITDRRTQSLRILDKQDELALEKKVKMDEFKAKANELGKSLAKLRHEAKTGTTKETGTVYLIPDYDARRMGIYNGHGELIESRTLKPEERQRNMFISSSTGTDN